MEIQIDNETDEEIAQAIATAVSEHLGRGVELVGEGGTLAEACAISSSVSLSICISMVSPGNSLWV